MLFIVIMSIRQTKVNNPSVLFYIFENTRKEF